MIKVGNIKSGDEGEYCGIPSPLGNPFAIHGSMTREYACDLYDKWLRKKISEEDKAIIAELTRLCEVHKQEGELTLLCFCAPLRCHCDTIKEVLENETL